MTDAPRIQPAARVLIAAGEALARSGDLDAALERIVAALAAAISAAGAVLLLQDPDRAEVVVGARVGIDEATARALAVATGDPDHAAARALARRELVLDGPSAYAPLVIVRDGVQLPLGVLAVERGEAVEFDADARAILTAAADLAAVAVDRARLASIATERAEWFERVAHADPLTGLANARTLARVLELELARASRQGSDVSIALFDVDGFRALNDEAGHTVGDDVLREVAAVVAESVRLVDTVGRWGGDEFLVVAPGPAGMTVAKRIMDGIAALPQIHGRRVSISAGLARFPRDGATSENLIDAARAALQAARTGGVGGIGEPAPTT